jgi:hypothetical protein
MATAILPLLSASRTSGHAFSAKIGFMRVRL